MPVELRSEQRGVPLDTRRLKRQAEFLLAAVGERESALSLLLTDDRRMARLHERWMGEEGPTDVMAFPTGEPRGKGESSYPFSRDSFSHSPILGDIVISVETAARRRPRDPAGEVLRCLVHGVLHLAGYDHRGRAGRLKMNRQARLLRDRAGAA